MRRSAPGPIACRSRSASARAPPLPGGGGAERPPGGRGARRGAQGDSGGGVEDHQLLAQSQLHYHVSGGEPTINGYSAANVVQVTLDDLDRIGSVIDAARAPAPTTCKASASRCVTRTRCARRRCARRRPGRARRRRCWRGPSGSRWCGCSPSRRTSPRLTPLYGHPVARAAGLSASAVPTPVEAGALEVTADVTLTVEVGPAAR